MINKLTLIILLIVVVVIFIIRYWKGSRVKDLSVDTLYYADDVTKMNKTKVDRIYYAQSVEDLIDIVKLAKKNNRQVIPRGQTHTMGGQTIARNGYVVDMKFMNHIVDFNKEQKYIVVEPGITWSDLIRYVNDYGLSPKILQSYSSFSVGGTVSVNAHGITDDKGMYDSVEEIKLIDGEGKIITCNRNKNEQLFSLVIGGYGLFGIIFQITLNLVNNVSLYMEATNLNVSNFDQYYTKILKDNSVNIKLARINITNMDDICLYTFKTEQNKSVISPIEDNPREMSKASQLLYKWVLPKRSIQMLRYDIELLTGKPMDFNTTKYDRNGLLYESAVPLAKLYNPLINLNVTHILQEYFIPKRNFVKWMRYLKQVFVTSQCSDKKYTYCRLLNITIRYLLKDETTFLKYAPEDMYAFVLYYRCEKHDMMDKELKGIHNKLVNYALKLNGTFYLPYRHHYSYDQLYQSYPNITEFMNLKRYYDPGDRFSNLWYDNYKNIANANIENHDGIYQDVTYDKGYKNHLDSTPSDPNYNFKTVFSSPTIRRKMKQFLKHVFYVLPADEVYSILTDIMKRNIRDIDVFINLKKAIETKGLDSGINKIKSQIGYLKLLKGQRDTLSTQIYSIMKALNINSINGYAAIGDPGYYIKSITSKEGLTVNRPIYIVHNKESSSMIDHGTILPSNNGQFIKFDYTYKKSSMINKIPENSLDLVTCFIGLHHFTIDQIDKFLKIVYKLLNSKGLFILREHNGYSSLKPLISCAHSVFNAITKESIETEKREIREFRTITEWRKIVESYGFVDMRLYTVQDNDPTENIMICFRKVDSKKSGIPTTIKNTINTNKDTYYRSGSQTYYTLPEWLSVDMIKEYGKFLEHTPWYNYPYGQNILLYWKTFIKEGKIISQKYGVKEALFSSYTVMNVVIGLVITILFIQLMILSFIPRLIYGSNDSKSGSTEAETIQMIVYNSKTDNLLNVRQVKVIKQDHGYYYIEVPRYKKFTDIVLKLTMNGYKIIEIAGQKNIQVKLFVEKSDSRIMKDIKYGKIDGLEYLFSYEIVPNLSYYEVATSVQINKMHNVIYKLVSKGVVIDHIYDF